MGLSEKDPGCYSCFRFSQYGCHVATYFFITQTVRPCSPYPADSHLFIHPFNRNLLSTCYTKHGIKPTETVVNMSNMISTFMELTPFSRQFKSKNWGMYIIQMMTHAMREERVALQLRSWQPVLTCVIRKEGCLGASLSRHCIMCMASQMPPGRVEPKKPSRRGNSMLRGNRIGNSLARTSPWGKHSVGAAWRKECEMRLWRAATGNFVQVQRVLSKWVTWFNVWGWPKRFFSF